MIAKSTQAFFCDRCHEPTTPSQSVCAACVAELKPLRWCVGCHKARSAWKWRNHCLTCKAAAQTARNRRKRANV
jgi:hypothetical protein